jgi:YVTN family beta-propeller protein
MGEYTVTPAATVKTDINSWAATYTGQIQYTIASGPYASSSATPINSTTTSASTSPLLASPKVITTVNAVDDSVAIAASASTIYISSYLENSTIALDASNAQSVANYTTPNIDDSVYYQGKLWVTAADVNTVYEINPSNGDTEASLPSDVSAYAITSGDGYIWVTSTDNGNVYKIDPSNDTLVGTYTTPHSNLYRITYSNGDLWVSDSNSSLVIEINASTGAVVQSVSVGDGPDGITTGGGYVWVANQQSNTVTQINQTTGTVVNTIPVGDDPSAIAYTGGAAWVTNDISNTVSEITSNGSVAATIPVGRDPQSIVADNGYLWVYNEYTGTVTEIES